MLNTRKNIFSLNWTQGLAIEHNLNEFCASSVLELWLRIQLYVTKETSANYATDETMPEDGLEKIANFVKSRNRFHRKCTSVLQKRMIAFIFALMYAFI